jgi:hypothetical protein
MDCSADTVLKTTTTDLPLTFLACNTSRDMIYASLRGYYDAVFMYDGTTGQQSTSVMVDGVPSGGGWSPGLNRLYCLPLVHPDPGHSCCLLSAIDGTEDSITGIVPLTVRAEHIVVDSVHNRLYFTYGSTACGCVGIVDCSQNVVTGYLYGGQSTSAMCYNPNNDRLYWNWSTAAWGGQGSSMIVYDCSTGTVADVVRTSGGVRASRLNLGLNKLYVYARDALGNYIIDVIDCERDSVIKVVDTPYEAFKELLLVPEDSTLWCLGVRSLVVIDCIRDSIVYAAADTLGTVDDACACPESRRIYTDGVTARLWSINMDKPGDRDTLHEWIPGSGMMRFLNIPEAHKAYWAASNGGVSTHLFVIDTRTNALLDSFWVNRTIGGMCLDRTANFVYCAPYSTIDTTVMVIDARSDSVVATIGLPSMIVAQKNPLVPNRATGRIYVEQYDVYMYGSEIPVIRDSMLIGLEELSPASPVRFVGPTIVSRGVPMRIQAESELWDASGRRAAVLNVGLNDISYLAAGVYFVRGPKTEDGRPEADVRKVVLTE